ncbi:hypothetical protein, partial [Streptomyces swartbergensis]|uniref:hypothetical protein n=1 Tax=Streptomyces swartbergensis TaxID=487165 RepID=UPI001ABF3245
MVSPGVQGHDPGDEPDPSRAKTCVPTFTSGASARARPRARARAERRAPLVSAERCKPPGSRLSLRQPRRPPGSRLSYVSPA